MQNTTLRQLYARNKVCSSDIMLSLEEKSFKKNQDLRTKIIPSTFEAVNKIDPKEVRNCACLYFTQNKQE